MWAFVFIFLVVAGFGSGVAIAASAFEDKPTAEPVSSASKPTGSGVGTAASGNAAGLSIGSFLGMNRFGLAPLRWGGNITDTFRWAKTDDGTSDTNHFQSIDVRAASYIWQPWFAQVNGNLNLSRGVADSSAADSETDRQSISGSGSLSIFPQSRFPFSASYSLSDSRTQARITQETQNERLSLRQEYRPQTGNSHYFAKYDSSTLTSSVVDEKDTVTSWQGGYTNTFRNQTLNLDVQYTESEQGESGNGLVLENYLAQHNWRASELLTVNSNASLTRSDFQSDDSASNRSQYMQAYSTASWNPNKNTSVSGGLRYFNLSNETGENRNEVQSLSGNASVNYRHTQNLSFNGSLTLATTRTDEGSGWISTQSGHVSYNNDPYVFGDFSYNWNVNGGLSNQLSSEESASTTYNAGGTHTLNHRYQISGASTLTSYVSESLTARYGKDYGGSQTVSHNAGASLGVTLSEKLGGGITLSASDTRTFGDERSDNQSLSMQTTANLAISSYSSAAANFNLQWNRSGRDDPASDGLATWGATGSASYMHSRAFGIPRLRYSLMFNLNYSSTNARLLGDADADRVRDGYTIAQHLDYQIGRMDARLTATRAVQDGKENAMIYLQIGRAFGNY